MESDYQYADVRIAYWLGQYEYHPRSDKHGKALCEYFLDDLLHESEKLREFASKGKVVYDENHVVGEKELIWNVDLVLGPPVNKSLFVPPNKIARGELKEIWMAIDAKSIMTEHGKARRNRQRDINSFADIVRHHYPKAVKGAIVIINIADRFKSPLRESITTHTNISKLVEESVQLFREIEHAPVEGNRGIEGIGVIVISHTNIFGEPTKLITAPPAPQKGDKVHYQTFLQAMKKALEKRYLS
jgi:hypothetical protein